MPSPSPRRRTPDTKVLRFLPGSDAFLAADARSGALMKCTLRTWAPGPRLGKAQIGFSALARRKDGALYALDRNGSDLYLLDAATGAASRVGRLTIGQHVGGFSTAVAVGAEGAAATPAIRHVRGLAFSDQPHELWGVLPNGSLRGQRTDAIVRINTETATIDQVHLLNRCDVLSIACPPRAGGPWYGVTKFVWCATGGLYGLKWANQDDEMIRLGAPTDGGQVRDICFSRDGTLYGIGTKGLSTINTEHGTVTPVLSLSSFMGDDAGGTGSRQQQQQFSLDGLVWLPFNPSSKMFAAPAPSEVAKRIYAQKLVENGGGGRPGGFDLLSAIGLDMDGIKPSREWRAGATTGAASSAKKDTGLSRRRRRSSTFGKLSFAQKMRQKKVSQDVYHEEEKEEEEEEEEKAVVAMTTMWVEAKAPSGRSYWWHRETRETTWEQPREHQVPARSPPPPPPQEHRAQLASGPAIARSSDVRIARFLRGLGLPQYVADFEREELTVGHLRELATEGRGELDDALKSLGMTKMGQRLKVWMALR